MNTNTVGVLLGAGATILTVSDLHRVRILRHPKWTTSDWYPLEQFANTIHEPKKKPRYFQKGPRVDAWWC